MDWNIVDQVRDSRMDELIDRGFLVGLKAGLAIDDFAPRLSFFWGIGMNFYMVCFLIENVDSILTSRKLLNFVQHVVYGLI